MGGGGDSQTSTTESTPWEPAQGHITNAMDWAQSLVGSMANNVPTMGNIGSNDYLNNAWMAMGDNSGFNQMAGQLGQAGAGMMGQFDADAVAKAYEEMGKGPNLYNQQNMRDTLLADKQAVLDESNSAIMANLNKATAQATGQIYGNAAGQGNVGSSRTQLASGQAAGTLASNAQSTMANLTSQAYDTASSQAMANEQARLQGLGQYTQGQMGMAQAGSQMLGAASGMYQQGLSNQMQAGAGIMSLQQQNQLINYQNAMNQWMAPQNLVGWYSGIAQGAGGLGGTSVSTQPIDRTGQMMGIAGSLGSAALMSDKRLKTNIKKVSTDLMLDLDLYEWTWNNDIQKGIDEGLLNKEQWERNTKGFIAQEVQELYPEAVIETEDGYLMVDYGYLFNLAKERQDKGRVAFKDGKWVSGKDATIEGDE